MNSSITKTAVETFLVEEITELIHDSEKLQKWNDMVEVLGLEGQKKIQKNERSPIPFLHLKKTMENILRTLCPAKDSIENFKTTPIPLEVLDLIGLSVRERYFGKIEIWYDDKNPDPCVIGITGFWYQSEYSNPRNADLDGKQFKTFEDCKEAGATGSIYFCEDQKYLIAKWGDVKYPFESLKEMAIKRFKAERAISIKRDIANLQRELEDIDIEAMIKFN